MFLPSLPAHLLDWALLSVVPAVGWARSGCECFLHSGNQGPLRPAKPCWEPRVSCCKDSKRTAPPPRSPSDPQKLWGRVVQPPGFSRADGEVLIELGASLFLFLHLSSVILPLTVNEDVRLGGSQVESGEDLALVILPERLLGEGTPRVSPNS